MEKVPEDTYRKFLELLDRHANEMNKFLFDTKDQLSSASFSHLKLMVGNVLGHGQMPVQDDICQKYPALKLGGMK